MPFAPFVPFAPSESMTKATPWRGMLSSSVTALPLADYGFMSAGPFPKSAPPQPQDQCPKVEIRHGPGLFDAVNQKSATFPQLESSKRFG